MNRRWQKIAALLASAFIWTSGPENYPTVGMRITRQPQHDTVRFDDCLGSGTYSVAGWCRDSLWHGMEATFAVCPRGDLNGDGIINSADVVLIVNIVYKGAGR